MNTTIVVAVEFLMSTIGYSATELPLLGVRLHMPFPMLRPLERFGAPDAVDGHIARPLLPSGAIDTVKTSTFIWIQIAEVNIRCEQDFRVVLDNHDRLFGGLYSSPSVRSRLGLPLLALHAFSASFRDSDSWAGRGYPLEVLPVGLYLYVF